MTDPRLDALIARMRDDRARFRMFAGSQDVIAANTVDDWADELEALSAALTAITEPVQTKDTGDQP